MKIRYLQVRNFRGIKKLNLRIDSDFTCLIGHGDSCKSTIITAIDYALSPRWNLSIDDSDFFNQEIENPISISVTLCEWDENNEEVRKFFTESKFGQFIGGYNKDGFVDEPTEEAKESITINLTIDKSLEPKWCVVKGEETKGINAAERSIFGVGRIDVYLDNNFTWGRNSILTRLSSKNDENLNSILSKISRKAKDQSINLPGCNGIASSIKTEAEKFGVKIAELLPKVDIQKLSFASGALALHHENIPLRNFGSGSKKLISCAMQMKLHDGKNITLIDEIELGLEPHRIRGLIKNLKESGQQIITTTHSPVVLRELNVADHELCVCRRKDGEIEVKSLAEVPNSQGPIRSNAEAFLGRAIVVCEGATEVGCVRALDEYKAEQGDVPAWSLNTAYYDAKGIGNIKEAALALNSLGYKVAVLCDNDAPQQFSTENADELKALGIEVFCWDEGNSTEHQIFNDIGWKELPGLFDIIANAVGIDSSKSLVHMVKTNNFSNLSDDLDKWTETTELRKHLGEVSGGKIKSKCSECGKNKSGRTWFKRIEYAEAVFKYAIPKLAADKTITKQLEALWGWVQSD